MNNSIEYYLISFIASIITITVHEWSKALISHKLGDPLPAQQGRLIPSPLRHIDPLGLIFMTFFSFGWGKPLDTAALYYKDRKRDTILTYTLPSAINLLLGIVLMIFSVAINLPGMVYVVIHYTAIFNIRNAFFNLIPVYPLDGAKILSIIKGPNQVVSMANNQSVHQLILIICVVWGLVGRIINPLTNGIIKLIIGVLTGFSI